MNWTRGWIQILICYGLTAAGVLIGFIRGGVRGPSLLRFPLTAIPVFLVAFLVCAIIQDLLRDRLPPLLLMPLTVGLLFIFGGLAGRALVRSEETGHQRGTLLEPASTRLPKVLGKSTGLRLAGLPVHKNDETKHFKMIGTTGTGKSTAIRELLEGALERGDRAVIADPDGSYLQHFYEPTRGDVILNPFDTRAARWNLFGEMTTLYDADQLALSLIPDTEGTERPWRGYARVFLTSVLRQLHRVKHDEVAELYRLISTTPIDDLRDLLGDTPAGPYLAQDNGKF